MSNVDVFVFDEIFGSMVASDQLAKLKAMSVELHVISKKCKITAYEPINNPKTQKVLCINPDFVNWHFAADEYKEISGLKVIVSSSDNIS